MRIECAGSDTDSVCGLSWDSGCGSGVGDVEADEEFGGFFSGRAEDERMGGGVECGGIR